MVRGVKRTFKLHTVQHYRFTQSCPNIPMKANRKQNAVKLTASKIGTQVMVQVFTKYGKQCLPSSYQKNANKFQKPHLL